MKKVLLAVILCSFVACESFKDSPPPVTAKMTRTSGASNVDLARLREGRTLFVSRCIECHTLPPIAKYRATEWPGLVAKMAKRADLDVAQRNSITAYILAVRSTKD